MEEAKFLYQLTKVIQAYREGTLSSNLFNDQVDDLLASFDPESKEISRQLRKLVRESKFPPHISERLLSKLEDLQPYGAHNRRVEDRVDEGLPGVETKTIRRIRDSSIPEDLASDSSPELNADPVPDSSPEPGADASSGSTADSSLLRSLLNWQEGGHHKAIQPNAVIRGTYRLESKVGKGGMGEVWKAVDLIQDAGDSRDRYVAIKFLSNEIRGHEYALKALVREFARYKKLIHSNIVRAYELNRDEDAVFIVMEFLPGLPLNKFIKKHPDGISLNEARPIIKGMCHALAYAHQEGVIHLDFKPGNVFYDPETGMTKVIDFGIARLAKQQEREETRFDPGALGAKTKTYATPEMLVDSDPESSDDVYGLSCVIYELLTGTHPFNGTNSISAEHQGLRPTAINGLDKAQFGAIKRGLAFRRKVRTKSADTLYRQIFPESAETGWKLSRNAVMAVVILAVVVVVPLLYKGVDRWRLQRIAVGIQQLDTESVNRFHGLGSENQFELVTDELTRDSLVRYYISKATPKNNALDAIQRLEPNVQRSLFRTRDIRKLLIVHSVNMIDLAVQEDDFSLAADIADRIASQYPDSRRLADQLALVNSAKGKRLIDVTKHFDDCLYDRSQSLVDLLPCLTESADHLNHVDRDIQVLNNPRLSARFIRETRNALSENDLGTAEKLLSAWREMIPAGSSERVELSEQLLQQRQVGELAAQILAASNMELESLIRKLRTRDAGIRNAVLLVPQIRDKLLGWYRIKIQSLVDSGQYKVIAGVLSQAKEIYSDDRVGLESVTDLENSVVGLKTKNIKALADRYWAYLGQEEPDTDGLLALNREIRALDPESNLIDYPRIQETYAENAGSAIENGRFDVAERYLQGWRLLRPGDSKTDSYIELSERRSEGMRAAEKRAAATTSIQDLIDIGQFNDVLSKLNGLNESFSETDRIAIANDIKTPFLEMLSEQVEIAIKNENYTAAGKLVRAALESFPDDNSMMNIGEKIDRVQANQVMELVSAYQVLLNAKPLQASELFRQLTSVHSVDKDYLAGHPGLFKKLGDRIKTLISTDHPLTALQDVFAQWESFPINTEESVKIYRSAKNYIALRCLFKAKVLKGTAELEKADEYLMFGLSLNPSDKITDSLNRELAK